MIIDPTEAKLAAAEAELEGRDTRDTRDVRDVPATTGVKKKTISETSATKTVKKSSTLIAKPPSNQGWVRLLTVKKNGDIVPSVNNARLVLTHDDRWKNVLAYDEFFDDIVTRKLPPFPKDLQPTPFEIGVLTEQDVARTRCWIEQVHGFDVADGNVASALRLAADRVRSHPVKEQFATFKWDGKPRIDTWLVDLAGAVDSPYVREVGKNFLIGAVARIYSPGCQVDSMPIFEGEQGAGKTTMVKILGGEWFLSTSLEIGDKDTYQTMRKKWIIEMGELDALGRAEVSHVKQFISQSTDTYRPSYARKAMDFPRHNVFCGTVNPENGTGYLKDNTGARRFWPVAVGVVHRIRLDKIAELRGQLIAEAIVRFKKGEQWHFTEAAIIREAAAVAEERRQVDPWEETVARWLRVNRATPGDKKRGVTTHEILTTVFEMEMSKVTRLDEMRVAGALRKVGWDHVTRETRTGLTTRVYRPGLKLSLVASEGGVQELVTSASGTTYPKGDNGHPQKNGQKVSKSEKSVQTPEPKTS